MNIVYRPDDGPPVTFEFIPGALETPESEAVEAVGGYAWDTYEEFGALFFRGSQRARRAALWVCLRRTQPRLRFEDLSIRPDMVDVEYSDHERHSILQVMLADPDIDPEQRENLTRIVGENLLADAEQALAEAGVERDHGLPKDQPDSSGSTDSTSPTTA